MKELVWKQIADLATPGFFITAEIACEDRFAPIELEDFIIKKLAKIKDGINGRRFTFKEGGWRIILTFFPTNCVVDERYALKNKVFRNRFAK